MRRKPFKYGDIVQFTVPPRGKYSHLAENCSGTITGTIIKIYHRYCFCQTEQRGKQERTHALVRVGKQQVKIPYRRLI